MRWQHELALGTSISARETPRARTLTSFYVGICLAFMPLASCVQSNTPPLGEHWRNEHSRIRSHDPMNESRQSNQLSHCVSGIAPIVSSTISRGEKGQQQVHEVSEHRMWKMFWHHTFAVWILKIQIHYFTSYTDILPCLFNNIKFV